MYRMKGNRDGSGRIAPAIVLMGFPAALLAPSPAATSIERQRPHRRGSRARVAWATAAGLGAGLIAVGSAGLIAAARDDGQGTVPEGPDLSAISSNGPPEVSVLTGSGEMAVWSVPGETGYGQP